VDLRDAGPGTAYHRPLWQAGPRSTLQAPPHISRTRGLWLSRLSMLHSQRLQEIFESTFVICTVTTGPYLPYAFLRVELAQDYSLQSSLVDINADETVIAMDLTRMADSRCHRRGSYANKSISGRPGELSRDRRDHATTHLARHGDFVLALRNSPTASANSSADSANQLVTSHFAT
jgi:hypothetical protein